MSSSYSGSLNVAKIKALVAHHSVVKKKIEKLLVQGASDPSTGGTDFYCNVFVVPKCMGGFMNYN